MENHSTATEDRRNTTLPLLYNVEKYECEPVSCAFVLVESVQVHISQSQVALKISRACMSQVLLEYESIHIDSFNKATDPFAPPFFDFYIFLQMRIRSETCF